ncbi:MAG: hypothetical protein IPI14_12650 [Polaromonas sp.]|nr:hypothetical protein [Polaromonas sp.]
MGWRFVKRDWEFGQRRHQPLVMGSKPPSAWSAGTTSHLEEDALNEAHAETGSSNYELSALDFCTGTRLQAFASVIFGF